MNTKFTEAFLKEAGYLSPKSRTSDRIIRTIQRHAPKDEGWGASQGWIKRRSLMEPNIPISTFNSRNSVKHYRAPDMKNEVWDVRKTLGNDQHIKNLANIVRTGRNKK